MIGKVRTEDDIVIRAKSDWDVGNAIKKKGSVISLASFTCDGFCVVLQ